MPTVKVRVAVAVDRDGKWNAVGGEGCDDEDMMSLACDVVAEGERRYWLVADLELPESSREIEIMADVEPGK